MPRHHRTDPWAERLGAERLGAEQSFNDDSLDLLQAISEEGVEPVAELTEESLETCLNEHPQHR